MNTCNFEFFKNFVYKPNNQYVEIAEKAFLYLNNPNTIYRMIIAIEMGLPPLNAICKQLENNLDCSNIVTRQIIGREMNFILKHYGFIQTNIRPRLRKACIGNYFKVGAEYIRDKNYKGCYKVNVNITQL